MQWQSTSKIILQEVACHPCHGASWLSETPGAAASTSGAARRKCEGGDVYRQAARLGWALLSNTDTPNMPAWEEVYDDGLISIQQHLPRPLRMEEQRIWGWRMKEKLMGEQPGRRSIKSLQKVCCTILSLLAPPMCCPLLFLQPYAKNSTAPVK